MDLELDESLCFSYLEKSFLKTLLDVLDRIFVADCQTVSNSQRICLLAMMCSGWDGYHCHFLLNKLKTKPK